MEFRIADTFTGSLTKLTGDEQKAVKTAAFDLQLNPAQPSLQFHKLDKAKDRRFWSVRVNSDVRLIVHRTDASLLLCYVAHHDGAYHWAERRKLETHPKTGAAQLVEIRETVQEIRVPRYVEAAQPSPPKPLLFAGVSEDRLLGHGVPAEWLAGVRNANEDTLLELADHLPSEAAEALLDLATGVMPQAARPVVAGSDPFAHPDAQRRFRAMANVEELERALDYPWDKWTVFLHPAQRTLVERDYSGPARVAGSAGTGKTIVALHRAVFLTRANPDARVLLTTFSDTLANALRTKLRALIGNEPRLGERLEVHSMNAIGRRLFELNFGGARVASDQIGREVLGEAAIAVEGHKFSARFLLTEWEHVVDAWQLETWESYRDVVRLGRKTRLTEQSNAGILPHEFGLFVRSAGQLGRAQAAIKESGLAFKILDEHVETTSGYVSISTMHLAKGLEFRAVVVMACDDEIIPLQERIETVGDDAELQEGYDTERHLLYVACTRARDHLLVTSVKPVSEFLDDLRI